MANDPNQPPASQSSPDVNWSTLLSEYLTEPTLEEFRGKVLTPLKTAVKKSNDTFSTLTTTPQQYETKKFASQLADFLEGNEWAKLLLKASNNRFQLADQALNEFNRILTQYGFQKSYLQGNQFSNIENALDLLSLAINAFLSPISDETETFNFEKSAYQELEKFQAQIPILRSDLAQAFKSQVPAQEELIADFSQFISEQFKNQNKNLTPEEQEEVEELLAQRIAFFDRSLSPLLKNHQKKIAEFKKTYTDLVAPLVQNQLPRFKQAPLLLDQGDQYLNIDATNPYRFTLEDLANDDPQQNYLETVLKSLFLLARQEDTSGAIDQQDQNIPKNAQTAVNNIWNAYSAALTNLTEQVTDQIQKFDQEAREEITALTQKALTYDPQTDQGPAGDGSAPEDTEETDEPQTPEQAAARRQATDIPTADEINAHEEERAGFYEIARTKNQLQSGVNAILKKEFNTLLLGFSEAEVDIFIQRYAPDLNDEIWQLMIEQGGLQGKMTNAQLSIMIAQLADRYHRYILQQFVNDPSILEEDSDLLSKLDPRHAQKILNRLNKNKINFDEKYVRKFLSAEELNDITQSLNSLQADNFAQYAESVLIENVSQQEWSVLCQNALTELLQNNGKTNLQATILSSTEYQNFTSSLYSRLQEIAQADDQKKPTLITQLLGFLQAQSAQFAAANSEINLIDLIQNEQLQTLIFYSPQYRSLLGQLYQKKQSWQKIDSTNLTDKQKKLAGFYQQLALPPTAGQVGSAEGAVTVTAENQPSQQGTEMYFAVGILSTHTELTKEQLAKAEITLYFYYTQHEVVELQQAIGLVNNLAAYYQTGDAGILSPETQGYLDGVPQSNLDQSALINQARQAKMQGKLKQAQALMSLAKIGADIATGNIPGALMKLATDKEARQALIKYTKKIILFAALGLLLQLLFLLWLIYKIWEFFRNLLKQIWQPIQNAAQNFWQMVERAVENVSNFVGNTGNSLGNFGAQLGSLLGGGGSETITITTIKTTSDARNALASTFNQAVDAYSATTSQISQAAAAAGVGKSLAVVVSMSILSPFIIVGLLTIIVITVIGGSMNDLPAGYNLTGGSRGVGTYCFEGDDRIVKSAEAIVADLQPGFWKYWNNHPSFPQHWDQTMFINNPSPKYPGPINGYPNALFWCAWLVSYAYEANNIPIAHSPSVAAHHNYWKANYEVKNLSEFQLEDGNSNDPDDRPLSLPLGAAIFIGEESGVGTNTPAKSLVHIAILCEYNVKNGSGSITTCDSNNWKKKISYPVLNKQLVEFPFPSGNGLRYWIGKIGLPPNDLSGSCDGSSSTQQTEPTPKPGGLQ